MRSDFTKVLTERPRKGGRDAYGSLGKRTRRKKIGDDEVGQKQGMRRPYMETGDHKEFTDLINPLLRYLYSRVGKPWDKTYAEICKHLKGRSTQQQHLLDHVRRWVETNAVVVDKKVYGPDSRPSWKDFYVGNGGILRAAPLTGKWWKREVRTDPNKRTINGVNYERINGIWYHVIEHKYETKVWDEERNLVPVTRTETIKRQLTTKGLKRLKLENSPD